MSKIIKTVVCAIIICSTIAQVIATEKIILSQKDLKIKFQEAILEQLNPNTPNASVQVVSGEKVEKGSGVTSINFNITPAEEYIVEFEAKGNCNLISYVAGDSFKRTNFAILKLAEKADWVKQYAKFTAPEGSTKAKIYILSWQTPNTEFEVRNFKVTQQ